MNRLKRLGLGLLAVALLGSTAACSTRAPSDYIVLYYASGNLENKAFHECIEPGQAGTYPVDDEVFYLPTSLRTWNIRPEGGDTDKPIKSGSKPATDQPGPEVVVYAAADFFINTDCSQGKDSPIVRFWEILGRRYEISADGDGKSDTGVYEEGSGGFRIDKWRELLLNTLVSAEEKAIREQTRKYSADDLDGNIGGIWGEMEKQLGPLFLTELRTKLGGDFFCGTGYQRGKEVEWTEWVADEKGGFREEKRKGKCPPIRISITDVNFADAGIAEARANVFKAEQNRKAALIKAQSDFEVAQIKSKEAANAAYLELRRIEAELEAAKECAKNPNCTLIIGIGADVNLPTK